jgi:septal ring factor EnvC (AmiA/AmiB activator)
MRVISVCLIACLAFFFSFSIEIYAGEYGAANKQLIKERKRLGNIEERIKKEKKEIKKDAGKERELLQELAVIDAVLAKRRDAVRKAEKKLAELKKRISFIKNRIKILQKEKRKRKQGLKKRLTALYKIGNTGPVNMMFSSTSHYELEKRYVLISSVIERDALAIEKYLSGIDDLNDSYKVLDAKRSEAKAVRLKLAAQKEKTQRQLNKKKRLIASIARSRALHEKKLAELKSSSLRLEKLLVRLEDSLNSSDYVPYVNGGFSALKGQLDMPFDAEVTAFFGKNKDKDFNTYIVRKGIDIAAPWGSEVVAIYDGKVNYADSFK